MKIEGTIVDQISGKYRFRRRLHLTPKLVSTHYVTSMNARIDFQTDYEKFFTFCKIKDLN